MVVGCWQTVQVVIDTEEDQLTNKPSLYIKSKNLITTTGSAVQTPLEESSDGIADTPLSTPAEEKKDEKNKDTSNTTNKGPVEFPLVIPDKCQLKAKVTTGDTTSEGACSISSSRAHRLTTPRSDGAAAEWSGHTAHTRHTCAH